MTNVTTRTRATELVLKDVTFNFPRLGKAHAPRFENNVDGPQYSVQVQDLPAEDFDTLASLGVSVQEMEEGRAVNFKAYVTNARGEINDFKVYDAEGNELSMEDREKIGYGSKGHVIGYMYDNAHGTKSVRMTDVVITELVEREPMDRAARVKKLILGG